MRPRRVLFISKSAACPSTRYRAATYFNALAQSGWEPGHLSTEGGLGARLGILKRAGEVDVVVIVRKTFARPYLRLLAARARRLVFDLDDAVFSGSGSDASETRRKRFSEAARCCQGIWAGNDFLSEVSAEYNARVSVIPTSVDTGRYRVDTAKPQDRVDLVWIGSGSTRKYLEQSLPVLESATGSFPSARLKIIADFDLVSEKLETLGVPWSQAVEARELAASHIGIAPMPENAWTRGKCGLKVLQYMAAGLPVISSPSGVNAEFVIHGETGFLAGSPGEWRKAVETLVEDPELRRSMGMAGRKRVEAYYSTDVTFRKMLNSLEKITNAPRS